MKQCRTKNTTVECNGGGGFIVLCDNYQLLLPIASFIILMYPTQLTARMCSGVAVTVVVR